MDGAIFGGGSGRSFAIFDELVGKGEMAFRSDMCVFFTEIGCISGNVEDHVSGMIVECGIRVGFHVV